MSEPAPKRLVLFHTAKSNEDIFEVAARGSGSSLELQHVVQPTLLARAQAEGRLSDAVLRDAIEALRHFSIGGTPVLCTCSTIGPAADHLAQAGFAVARADRALADEAFADADTLGVVIAAPSTLEPTRRLFAEASAGKPFDLHLVEGAWDAFNAGDLAEYHGLIADCARALQQRHDAIALAQASMAPVAALPGWRSKLLDSPSCSMRAMRKWIA